MSQVKKVARAEMSRGTASSRGRMRIIHVCKSAGNAVTEDAPAERWVRPGVTGCVVAGAYQLIPLMQFAQRAKRRRLCLRRRPCSTRYVMAEGLIAAPT